jgi:L-methionine (R)-S-oxide reductase
LAELIVSDGNLTTDEKYKLLNQQLVSLVQKEENLISNLANVTAAFKQTFDKISWVGFYLFDGKKLYLGPFQGNVACTNIEIGKGVCGQSAKLRKTLIVPDVHQFPGHIFCDADSKSEVVVPLLKNNALLGVLDLDSTEFNSFNEIDKFYLEQICKFLSEEIF